MAINSFFIKERINQHLKENIITYCVSIGVIIVGLIIGIYLSLTGYNYTSLLSSADKNMFDYITGTATYSAIFYKRLFNTLICVLIIVCVNFNVYTSVLGYIFISYQTSLVVLSCSAIITLYGLSGIINSILFVVPINLINLLVMIVIVAISQDRLKVQKKYKLSFLESCKESGFCLAVLICVLISVLICLIYSFILPLFIKSFVVMNY